MNPQITFGANAEIMCWIDEPLVKGSSNPSDDDLAQLRAQGFNVGISLLDEKEQPPGYDRLLAVPGGSTIYSIPIAENHPPSIEQIRDFTDLLEALPLGTKVLVFCQSGQGRTACMGAAYWIAQGLTASAAIERMSERCLDKTWPTADRQRVLREYETSQQRR